MDGFSKTLRSDSDGFGSAFEAVRPSASGRAKRWAIHAGHGDGLDAGLGSASASEGPHRIARRRGRGDE